METVHVLAIITAKPGRRAELLAAFQANVPNVHGEEGCLEYVATNRRRGRRQRPDAVWRGHLRRSQNMGQPRRPPGPRRRPTHGGLRRQNQGPGREPGEPRALAGVSRPVRGAASKPSVSALPRLPQELVQRGSKPGGACHLASAQFERPAAFVAWQPDAL
jgi:hypothetical protein